MVLHIPRKAGAAGAHTAQLLLHSDFSLSGAPIWGGGVTLKVPHPWLVTAPYNSPFWKHATDSQCVSLLVDIT